MSQNDSSDLLEAFGGHAAFAERESVYVRGYPKSLGPPPVDLPDHRPLA